MPIIKIVLKSKDYGKVYRNYGVGIPMGEN